MTFFTDVEKKKRRVYTKDIVHVDTTVRPNGEVQLRDGRAIAVNYRVVKELEKLLGWQPKLETKVLASWVTSQQQRGRKA